MTNALPPVLETRPLGSLVIVKSRFSAYRRSEPLRAPPWERRLWFFGRGGMALPWERRLWFFGRGGIAFSEKHRVFHAAFVRNAPFRTTGTPHRAPHLRFTRVFVGHEGGMTLARGPAMSNTAQTAIGTLETEQLGWRFLRSPSWLPLNYMFKQQVRIGRLEVIDADGLRYVYGGAPGPTARIRL